MKIKLVQRIDFFLAAIAILSGFLNIFNIWKDQNANAYYTAAVTSMLQSFHNFFFASFDPGGFVTVDKPPVSFWLQTLSASLFGLHGWSVILPQALAAVGSVLLMYSLVKPTFGITAARIASLVFACTPIAVAVSRSNNVDSLLVFALLLGTWMLFRGVRKEQWSLVIASFAIVGLAFNIKMLQAYMVVPAFFLFYLFASKVNWKNKAKVFIGSAAILILVSISWAVIVDAIPQEKRPYIGSSQTNSVLELAFGYNGIARLTGDRNGAGGNPPAGNFGDGGARSGNPPTGNGDSKVRTGALPNGGFNGGGNPPRGGFGGAGGAFNTGKAGPLRLFQSALSGQISWLLPFTAFASLGLLIGIRRRIPLTAQHKEALFWLAWLLPVMGFFSIAGFFHPYYLIMLAPPIAALTGAGWVELCLLYHNKESWKKWLLPVAILASAAFQLYILKAYTEQIGYAWSITIGLIAIVTAIILILWNNRKNCGQIAALVAITSLLIAPLFWAATPLLYSGNSMLPEAGPQLKSSGQGNQPSGNRQARPGGESYSNDLLQYLIRNNTGEKYLFATANAGSAESYIIQSGKAVMAMGGFSGSDPILTVDKLKKLIENKEVKYFMISAFGGGGRGGSSEVTNWIKANSTEIPSEEWQSSSSFNQAQNSPRGIDGATTLYKIN